MPITLNQHESRFETTIDGHHCVLEFALSGNVCHMNHVGVPDAVSGRGIAGELTRFALDHARKQSWQVKANCPYVKAWIERHPDYQELL